VSRRAFNVTADVLNILSEAAEGAATRTNKGADGGGEQK